MACWSQHKLKTAGVTGEVLDWFEHYLSDGKQRVVLPGAVSDWVFGMGLACPTECQIFNP